MPARAARVPGIRTTSAVPRPTQPGSNLYNRWRLLLEEGSGRGLLRRDYASGSFPAATTPAAKEVVVAGLSQPAGVALAVPEPSMLVVSILTCGALRRRRRFA